MFPWLCLFLSTQKQWPNMKKIGKLVLAGSILGHKLAHFVQAVEKISNLLSTRALLIAELSAFCQYGIENLLFIKKKISSCFSIPRRKCFIERWRVPRLIVDATVDLTQWVCCAAMEEAVFGCLTRSNQVADFIGDKTRAWIHCHVCVNPLTRPLQ